MICPNCSTHSDDGFKFCPECGQRLALAAAPPPGTDGAGKPAARLDEAAQAARLLEQAFELYDEGRYDEALGSCQAALALDPSLDTAHSLLGMIYERLGKTAEAVQQYQLVLRMNPDSIADVTKLDALLSRSGEPGRRRGAAVLWAAARRAPIAAGAAAAAMVLVVGFWATSRATSSGTGAARRRATSSARGLEPGASMPRPSTPALGMPGAEESLPAPGATPLRDSPSGSPAQAGKRPGVSLPAPPPANAWPPLRGAYPPAPPPARAPQAGPGGAVPGASMTPVGRGGLRAGRRDARPLVPAPIQGVEKINPGEPTALADAPGAALPAVPGAAFPREGARRSPRGAAPVLPPVTGAAERPATAAPPAGSPPAAAPPPSASISIQPLDDSDSRDATRGARQSAAPQPRAVTLAEAMQHQQLAAYYRRQGDLQAAYDEYQYARDLFRMIQQRGGPEAAVAAQGAAAAEYGMARLQGP